MMATARAVTHPPSWRLYASASALLLWACLWLNVNTGFWNIQAPHSLDEWQLLGRAILPFAVLPVAGLMILNRRKLDLLDWGPSRLLMIYGVLAAIASIVSPQPAWSLYWSMTFLATIATAWTFVATPTPVISARQMLQVTLAVMFVVAAIIAYMARGSIFGNTASAYGVYNDLNELSRSSGGARWAAVLGSVAAFLFALLPPSRLRRYALPCALFAALVITVVEPSGARTDRVSEYLHRGQTQEQFRTMTGRTQTYEAGVAAFWDAPVLGRGQWADRLIIGGHVHNSYLQALLNAGILGGIPYGASWIGGWGLFFRVPNRRRPLRPEDQTALLEAGTVMVFFTVRSVPETTTASFAVDLLVMAAIYVYLEALAVSIGFKSLERWVRIPLLASTRKG